MLREGRWSAWATPWVVEEARHQGVQERRPPPLEPVEWGALGGRGQLPEAVGLPQPPPPPAVQGQVRGHPVPEGRPRGLPVHQEVGLLEEQGGQYPRQTQGHHQPRAA